MKWLWNAFLLPSMVIESVDVKDEADINRVRQAKTTQAVEFAHHASFQIGLRPYGNDSFYDSKEEP